MPGTERPEVEVVSLARAALILGLDDRRAAESALRRAGISSGYPREQVEWLRDNRPGQGARTDLQRRTIVSEYGTLTNYVTGDEIRPATRDEWLASLRAGETGAFQDEDGRSAFVAGGYETEAGEVAAHPIRRGSPPDVAPPTRSACDSQ